MAWLSERQVEVGGRRVALLRGGEGAPLVLLHGAGCNHRSLAPLGEALRAADVILPSLPGRAGSDGPPLATVEAMAAWVDALTRALGVERFFLAGHSLGGATAMELALGSERVLGVALVATGARLRVHPATLAAIEEAAARGEVVEVPAAYHPQTPASARRREAEAKALTPPASALADWRAVHAFDRLGDVERIAAAALVLGGEDDPLTPPRYARYLAERIPGGRLALVAGASHMLPIERPDEVARLLDAFLGARLAG